MRILKKIIVGLLVFYSAGPYRILGLIPKLQSGNKTNFSRLTFT